jgi:hypothetical protein
VLGVACRERPTRVVGRKLGVTNGSHALTPHRVALVPNGEQDDGDVVEARQVALIEFHEGLAGIPLQGVVAPRSGEPSSHTQVGGVSQDVHVDLEASTSELMVWVTAVCGSPRVTETV